MQELPLLVSALPQQKHRSADRWVPDAGLMAIAFPAFAQCYRLLRQAQRGQDEREQHSTRPGLGLLPSCLPLCALLHPSYQQSNIP
ncbi:hypothetical protein MDA_GLEAN10012915 [Myotis davidii]|uniref:Uncharacterized protein n=1 Tax=Myotis davidii TaxID=225400 RepID=L5M4H4_MYODS|nr:hypothetical protein MDA_GLEAN10012915 [Myotis davidii]